MNRCPLIVLAILALLTPGRASDQEFPVKVSNWIPTDVDFGFPHPLWGAANRVGTVWDVYKDDGVVKVRKFQRNDDNPSIDVTGGKLICVNKGEFGSTVSWHPKEGTKVTVSNHHVQQFFRQADQTLAIGGIAHMDANIGEVLAFDRSGDNWKVSRLCKLVDEPQVVASENPKTFLVLTYSGLCRVSIDGWLQLLVVSAHWDGLHPRSLAVGDDGFAYVGFSQRIAKVSLESGDTTYLIPYEGIFEDDREADLKKQLESQDRIIDPF